MMCDDDLLVAEVDAVKLVLRHTQVFNQGDLQPPQVQLALLDGVDKGTGMLLCVCVCAMDGMIRRAWLGKGDLQSARPHPIYVPARRRQ